MFMYPKFHHEDLEVAVISFRDKDYQLTIEAEL